MNEQETIVAIVGNGESHNNSPRTKFGQLLSKIFVEEHICCEKALKGFGEAIASIQKPSRHIPYGHYTVNSWLNGRLLPAEPTMIAICKELEDHYGTSAEKLESLRTLYIEATAEEKKQRKRPTELTEALRYARDISRLKDSDIIDRIGQWNSRLSDQWHISKSIIAAFRGFVTPTKHFTYAMSQWAQPINPPLIAVHEQMLRERADIIWEQASKEGSLGGMILAIRVRRGESADDFAASLAKYTCSDKTLSRACVVAWESDKKVVPLGRDSSQQTLCEPLVGLAKLADAQLNPLSRSIPIPWFTADMERIFRETFQKRATNINQSGKNVTLPSSEISDVPNRKEVKPSLRITAGKLCIGQIKPNLKAQTHQP